MGFDTTQRSSRFVFPVSIKIHLVCLSQGAPAQLLASSICCLVRSAHNAGFDIQCLPTTLTTTSQANLRHDQKISQQVMLLGIDLHWHAEGALSLGRQWLVPQTTSHEVIEQHAYRHNLIHALRGIVAQFYILGQGQITSDHARKLFSTLY